MKRKVDDIQPETIDATSNKRHKAHCVEHSLEQSVTLQTQTRNQQVPYAVGQQVPYAVGQSASNPASALRSGPGHRGGRSTWNEENVKDFVPRAIQHMAKLGEMLGMAVEWRPSSSRVVTIGIHGLTVSIDGGSDSPLSFLDSLESGHVREQLVHLLGWQVDVQYVVEYPLPGEARQMPSSGALVLTGRVHTPMPDLSPTQDYVQQLQVAHCKHILELSGKTASASHPLWQMFRQALGVPATSRESKLLDDNALATLIAIMTQKQVRQRSAYAVASTVTIVVGQDVRRAFRWTWERGMSHNTVLTTILDKQYWKTFQVLSRLLCAVYADARNYVPSASDPLYALLQCHQKQAVEQTLALTIVSTTYRDMLQAFCVHQDKRWPPALAQRLQGPGAFPGLRVTYAVGAGTASFVAWAVKSWSVCSPALVAQLWDMACGNVYMASPPDLIRIFPLLPNPTRDDLDRLVNRLCNLVELEPHSVATAGTIGGKALIALHWIRPRVLTHLSEDAQKRIGTLFFDCAFAFGPFAFRNLGADCVRHSLATGSGAVATA